jgi:hypothetical protein
MEALEKNWEISREIKSTLKNLRLNMFGKKVMFMTLGMKIRFQLLF